MDESTIVILVCTGFIIVAICIIAIGVDQLIKISEGIEKDVFIIKSKCLIIENRCEPVV